MVFLPFPLLQPGGVSRVPLPAVGQTLARSWQLGLPQWCLPSCLLLASTVLKSGRSTRVHEFVGVHMRSGLILCEPQSPCVIPRTCMPHWAEKKNNPRKADKHKAILMCQLALRGQNPLCAKVIQNHEAQRAINPHTHQDKTPKAPSAFTLL